MPKQSLLAMKLAFGERSQYVAVAFAASFLLVQLTGVIIFSGGAQAATNLAVTTSTTYASSRTSVTAIGYSNDLARSITAFYSFDHGATASYGSNQAYSTRTPVPVSFWGPSGTGGGNLSGDGEAARLALGGGYVYTTSSGGGEASVKYYTLSGVLQGSWGTPGTGDGQFNVIKGIAVAPSGDVYVLDQYRVQRFTSTGVFVSSWGSYGGGGGAEMLSPSGIAVDGDGNVYVADANDKDIRKFAADGTFIDQWALSDFNYTPLYLVIAPDGLLHVLVSDSGGSLVQRLDTSDGSLQSSFSVGIGTYRSLAVDIHGSSYVMANSNQIRTYSAAGSALTVLTPSLLGSPLAAYNSYGMAITTDGVLYVRNDVQGTPGLSASAYGVVAIRDQISTVLASLTCGSSYHVRIKGVVGADTVYGDDQLVSTQACQTFAITTDTLPDGMVGDAYSTTIETNGPDGAQFSLLYGSMPAGLTLDENTGEISGTPLSSGTYSLYVLAEDLSGTGDSEEKMFTLVVNADVSFEITTTSLPSGIVDEAYSATIEDNSANPTEYYIIGGSFPPGLTLESSGTITGTPTDVGSYTFTAQAEDGYYNAPKELTIQITAGEVLTPIAITTTSLPDGTVGEDYSFDIETDNESGVTMSISAGSLPAGLSLSASGTLAGTPTTAGTSSFTVLANNGSTTDAQVLSLTVTEPEVDVSEEPIDEEPIEEEPIPEDGPDITEFQQEVPGAVAPPTTSSLKAPSIPQANPNTLFALAKRIPEPIAIGFPWLLLALALILVSIQYYQVHSEARATKRMQAAVANQERLVEEQNNFVALSTHYLHTPLTVMEGEIALMVKAGTLTQEQATKLRATLSSLSAEAEATLAQDEQIDA